jgi:hypothetical protein
MTIQQASAVTSACGLIVLATAMLSIGKTMSGSPAPPWQWPIPDPLVSTGSAGRLQDSARVRRDEQRRRKVRAVRKAKPMRPDTQAPICPEAR